MADNIQSFIKELAFEEALTNHLLGHGWNEVMMNPTEEQLVENWARIIYDNNRSITPTAAIADLLPSKDALAQFIDTKLANINLACSSKLERAQT